MAIFDKPFLFSELLRRTVFKGRPNFFNAKDFNKELLIIHEFIEEFNGRFGVWTNINFTIPSFSEVFNGGTNITTRSINLNWSAGDILYKGIKVPFDAGGIVSYTQNFSGTGNGLLDVPGIGNVPPTYVVLTGELDTVTYAENPVLCGIQADEMPTTAPSVDVEQYTNVQIQLVGEGLVLPNIICILGTIHPKYTTTGSPGGYGFLYNAFRNSDFKYSRGGANTDMTLAGNNSLYEFLMERVVLKLSNVINERQLGQRFNLADLSNGTYARHNVGLSNLVNHRQLVQAENLRDLTSVALARQNLGLGNSATRNVGYGAGDIAPGNLLPIGSIIIWSGSPSSVPTGWKICDGAGGTPNLSGRFVVGLDVGNTNFNLVGKIGGASEVTLSAAQSGVGLHKHTGYTKTDGEHKHVLEKHVIVRDIGTNALTNRNNIPGGSITVSTQLDGAHKHGLDMAETSASASEAHTNLPPYYTVCFIMFQGTVSLPVADPLAESAPLVYPGFSTPNTASKGGYTGTEKYIGQSNGVVVGSGITLTNPE